MSGVVYCRVWAVVSVFALFFSIWGLVDSLADGDYGMAAVMAVCCVLNTVWFAYFTKAARR